MRFNIISDFHFQPTFGYTIDGKPELDRIAFDFNKLEQADYLLIAGDIGTSEILQEALHKIKKDTKGKFKDIFWILGNHDYWDPFYFSAVRRKNKYLEEELEEDIVLLGTTLWTPVPMIDEFSVLRTMNDFNNIPDWNLKTLRDEYYKQKHWLKKKIGQYKDLGKKVVVMTHHAPRIELCPNYQSTMNYYAHNSSSINDIRWGVEAAYYVTDGSCNDLKPDVWISGHSHRPVIDKEIDGVRFVSHTIGYNGPWYGKLSELPSKHWYDFVIEI